MSSTELGELSLRRIALRLNDYSRLHSQDLDRPVVGRHVSGELQELRQQNAVVDIVAIAEGFTGDRLRSFRSAVTDQEVFTWRGRIRAWRKHAGVQVESCLSWRTLSGFIEVRNALQHGLGRLTERQLQRREEVLGDIACAGTVLDGDVVRVRDEDVQLCAHHCLEFVSWLDTTAPIS